jgi:hypothetical protein
MSLSDESKRREINDHDDGIWYLVNELIVDVDEKQA